MASAEKGLMVASSTAAVKVGDFVEVLDAASNNWGTSKLLAWSTVVSAQWTCTGNKTYPPTHVRHPKVLDLSQLKKEMDDNRGEELAIFPSYQVFSSIVRRNVMKWESAMMELEEFYDTKLQDLCRNAVMYLTLPKSLSHLLLITSLKIIADLRKNAVEMLQQEMEKEKRPFTMNHYLYDNLIKLVFNY
jgi:hypothetical protein